MDPLSNTPNNSAEPTAKAYFQVDVSSVGHLTGAGQIPGAQVGAAARALIVLTSDLLIGTTPALTLYVARGSLTAAETMIVIVLQMAAIMFQRKTDVPAAQRV